MYVYFPDNMAQRLPNESGDNLVDTEGNIEEGIVKHPLKVIA